MPRTAIAEKPATEAQLAARAAGAERLRAAAQVRKVAPVVIRPSVDTMMEEVAQGAPRKTVAPESAELEPFMVEPVERPLNQEKLDELVFMEEPIKVLVHESTNQTDVKVPEVWNGGQRQFWIRGVEKVVKRKFVEVLARMKKTVYSQRKVKDDEGIEDYENIPHTALQYPFVVIDDSERGKAWLKRVLREP